MKNLIFRHRRFAWQNAIYTIQFILTIYINSEKLILPGRCAPLEFPRLMSSTEVKTYRKKERKKKEKIFQLKVQTIEKNSKKWLPHSYLTIQNKLV